MPDASTVSSPLVTGAIAATVFLVMLAVGLAIDLRDLRWAWSRPGLVARGLLSVLVLVPLAGVAIAGVLDLTLPAQVGVALMAASPGAPVALRRSLDAGGHQSFAAVLQVLVALLAIVSMPVSVVLLNLFYGTHGVVTPLLVARQVFLAQLLPIGLGLAIRRAAPALAARWEPVARRLAAVMLAACGVLLVIVLGRAVLAAAPRTGPAVLIVTALALAVGHILGAPAAETRRAVAISSALRNPGLALLVASSSHAPPAVALTVLAYALWATLAVTGYVALPRLVQRLRK